jgi:hypothetical protein
MTCHINKRPTGLVNGFNHASFPNTDCATCHTINIGSSWSGARPHALTGPTAGSTLNCTSCHGSAGWSAHKLSVPEASHVGGTANTCTSCHKQFGQFKGDTTPTIAYLTYPHSATVLSNNCQVCHEFKTTVGQTVKAYTAFSQASAVVLVNKTVAWSGNTFNHDINNPTWGAKLSITVNGVAAPNCKACHAYATYSATGTNSTALGRWKFAHRPNGIRNGESTTPGCRVCH